MNQKFQKVLSANDVGRTGGHQAGILVPKSDVALLKFLPPLKSGVKNPSASMPCRDGTGELFLARLVYYNNKLHDAGGTRNEFRITGLTAFMRRNLAEPGDVLEISKSDDESRYFLDVRKDEALDSGASEPALRVKISSWSRVW